MKQKAIFIGLVILLVLLFSTCTRQSDFPVLHGPYLGQTPPGMIPEIFAPGIVSTGMREFASVFSPDGDLFFFSNSSAPFATILFMKQINNKWTSPQVAYF